MCLGGLLYIVADDNIMRTHSIHADMERNNRARKAHAKAHAAGLAPSAAELFDQARAKEGLAIAIHKGAPEPVEEEDAWAGLARIGYLVDGETREAAVVAFQRRFRPDAVGAGLEARTRSAIIDIARRVGRA